MMSVYPPSCCKVILILSGKRKSGKDYIAGLISKRLGEENCELLHLSFPLKKQYADEHNIDFEKLLDSSSFKERYRRDMIQWGERKREQDAGVFCRAVVNQGISSGKPIWIVTDARRKSDLSFFQDKPVMTVRINASEETRRKRSWNFVHGIDDVESECDLDDYEPWTFKIWNDGRDSQLENDMASICRAIAAMAGFDLKRE